MASRPIYLDNNSTTRTDPAVVEKMLPYFTVEYGNASSITHKFGQAAEAAVDAARHEVAELLGCDAKAIVFTSGATEANNLALMGIMRASTNGKHLIVNAAEHKAVLDPAKRLEAEGFDVTVLPVDKYGRVSIADIENAIRDDTVLVSVMHGNNEIGSLNPIAEIGDYCKRAGVLFHSDATQTVGKVSLDLSKLNVDLLSCSAHKMYGPKGVGVLYVRRGSPRVRIQPLLEGGGHERRMRSGTLPVQQIVGMGEACRLCNHRMQEETTHITLLCDQLRKGLTSSIDKVQFNGHPTARLPGNVHVSLPGINSNAMMMNMRELLAVSSGSACTTSTPEPSHVLLAMGLDPSVAACSIRFGIGRFNTSEEIEQATAVVSSTVARLRQFQSS